MLFQGYLAPKSITTPCNEAFEWKEASKMESVISRAGVFIVLMVLMNHSHPVVALIPLPHVSSVAAMIAAIHM